jgi:hypothetical protein
LGLKRNHPRATDPELQALEMLKYVIALSGYQFFCRDKLAVTEVAASSSVAVVGYRQATDANLLVPADHQDGKLSNPGAGVQDRTLTVRLSNSSCNTNCPLN